MPDGMIAIVIAILALWTMVGALVLQDVVDWADGQKINPHRQLLLAAACGPFAFACFFGGYLGGLLTHSLDK
jgi:hypothetical protein